MFPIPLAAHCWPREYADKASTSGYTVNPTWGCSQPQPTFAQNRSRPTMIGVRTASESTLLGGIGGEGDDSFHIWNDNDGGALSESLRTLPNKLHNVILNQCRDKLTPRQITALNWFSARISRYVNQLKVALLTDQITLAEKLAAGAEGSKTTNDGVDSGNESTTEGRGVNKMNPVTSTPAPNCPRRRRPCLSAPSGRQHVSFMSPLQPTAAMNPGPNSGSAWLNPG